MNNARRPKSRPPVFAEEGIEPLRGTTMLAHVESLLPSDGRGPLPDGGRPYPDRAAERPDENGWMPGAWEGVLSARGLSNPGDEPLLAAAAVIEACRMPLATIPVHVAAERLTALEWPDQLDRFLKALRESRPLNGERLAALSRWLCNQGVTMGQVKSGIALLGVTGGRRDVALVVKLGLLESLTLYSVVALRNLLEDPYPAVFDLARQVDGWARIHALRRLVGATDPAIRDWVLRGGYDSNVIVEETAYIGATLGGLAAALQGEVDDELLDHAGTLLAGLALGGPAEDMSDYASGALAMELYLSELRAASASMSRLWSLVTLDEYLRSDADRNSHLTGEEVAHLSSLATANLEQPKWKLVVLAGLDSGNADALRSAAALAPRFGLDTRPILRNWIEQNPHDDSAWYRLSLGASREELEDLLDRAEALLPFSAIPLGPSKAHMFGEQFSLVASFDYLLQEVERFPGLGWSAIEIGLQAKYTRSRYLAERALRGWPTDQWPPGARGLLWRCAKVEPDDDLKTRLVELAGRTTDTVGAK